MTVVDVDQLNRDPEPVTGTPNTSVEDHTYIQPPPNFANIQPVPAYGGGRRSCDHLQVVIQTQRVDQFLGQSVAELFAIPTHACKGQHGDRRSRTRAGPGLFGGGSDAATADWLVQRRHAPGPLRALFR